MGLGSFNLAILNTFLLIIPFNLGSNIRLLLTMRTKIVYQQKGVWVDGWLGLVQKEQMKEGKDGRKVG